MEILIILIVILVVFYFCYLNSKNNKLTKTEAFHAPDRPGVSVYELPNFEGLRYKVTGCRFEERDLIRESLNDKINSIKIPDGLKAVFFEHGARGGKRLSLSAGNYPNLADMGWSNMISFFDVYNV